MIWPKAIAAINVGTLTGSTGNFGPTWGFSILVDSKRMTMQLMLIMMPTVGFHAGVAGTVSTTASKFDNIEVLSPK